MYKLLKKDGNAKRGVQSRKAHKIRLFGTWILSGFIRLCRRALLAHKRDMDYAENIIQE